jgi:transcriptional regulator with XRE-family HTH domain
MGGDATTSMSISELRDVIGRLGLSVADTARLVGVDPRTMRRWLAGEKAVTPSVVILFRLIDAVPGVTAWLKEQFGYSNEAADAEKQ